MGWSEWRSTLSFRRRPESRGPDLRQGDGVVRATGRSGRRGVVRATGGF